MRIQTTFIMLALAGALHYQDAAAQGTTNTNNQVMFRVTFSATCSGFDGSKGRVVTTRITDRNIIAQATGGSPSTQGINRNFALVFNTDEDSLQVVDSQGNPVVDVVHFGGGAATGDARQTDRLTFMFFPGQTNEFNAETNVMGTALITERASRSNSSAVANRANITGRLQFMLTSDTPLGTTNLNFGSGTNVQICVGRFTTSRRFPLATTGITGLGANTTGTSGAGTNTTGATTGGGTNTTGTTGTSGVNGTGIGTTTPIIIITTPGATINTPTGAGTTSTIFGSTTGMLPSLTGNGSLPGLGTTIGTGLTSLTPFTTTTPLGFGTPISTIGGVTTTIPTGSITTTPLSPFISGTTTTPAAGLTGTTTRVILSNTGITTGF